MTRLVGWIQESPCLPGMRITRHGSEVPRPFRARAGAMLSRVLTCASPDSRDERNLRILIVCIVDCQAIFGKLGIFSSFNAAECDPFGPPEEAAFRFGHFLEEICRWEPAPLATPNSIEPGIELANDDQNGRNLDVTPVLIELCKLSDFFPPLSDFPFVVA